MSSLQRHTGVQDASMDNPYLRAYRRETGDQGFGSQGAVRGSLGDLTLRGYSVTWARHRTPRQRQSTLRQHHFVCSQDMKRALQFKRGTTVFLRTATPTVGQLIEVAARQSVEQEHSSQVSNSNYGSLE